mgnify:CR=1 FL=1
MHFVWSTDGTTRYLRVVRVGRELRADPVRDTRATGGAYDNGSDLAVRGDDEIHVLTYTGQYAVSTNGGVSWYVERVPWPAGETKNPALAVWTRWAMPTCSPCTRSGSPGSGRAGSPMERTGSSGTSAARRKEAGWTHRTSSAPSPSGVTRG